MSRRSARVESKLFKLEEQTEEVNCDNETVEGNEESSSGALSLSSKEKNPLNNPVILQNLFQLCPVSILASCRQVCKLWYNESLTTWRTAIPITISMEVGNSFKGMGYLSSSINRQMNRTPLLKEFMEFCDNLRKHGDTKPYRNIRIRWCEFGSTPQNFCVFKKELGKSLTTLHLFRCKFSSINQFREVIYKSCPILQKLVIEYCTYPTVKTAGWTPQENELECEEPIFGEHKRLKSLYVHLDSRTQEEPTLPVSWVELLSHFPSVLTFECSISSFCYSLFFQFPESELESWNILQAIKIIRKKDKTKLPFKHFQIRPYLAISRETGSHKKFALIQELRLPLRGCFIKIHPNLEQRFLTNTLSYIAESVNTIIIALGENEKKAGVPVEIPTWFRDFPFGIQMDNLTRLDSQGDLLGSFTFLKYAPNLEKFQVFDSQQDIRRDGICATGSEVVSNTCKEELANVKLVRVRKLRLEYIVSDDDIDALFKWMPNIAELTMILNDKQFGMVCRNWKGLRKIKVAGNRLTAAGVTEMEHVNEEGVEVRPNIANLERLESLILNVGFTPTPVFQLFLHLPNLQILEQYLVGSIKREKLDISSYQKAVQDNVGEQWIKQNGIRVLGTNPTVKIIYLNGKCIG